MSPLFSKAKGRARNAPADRSVEVQRLADVCHEQSHALRDLRDRLAGSINPDDFDFMTELGVELAAYSAILRMAPERQIDWLSHTIKLAETTVRRIANEQGGGA
jgi:hypothetical protein